MKSKTDRLNVWEHYVALDLKTLLLQGSRISESSWVLLANWHETEHLEFLRPSFLISTQILPRKDMGMRFSKSQFGQLSIFFQACSQGKASLDAMQRCFLHLNLIEQLPRRARFEEERRMFGSQMSETSPNVGLNGFLIKESFPFSKTNQYAESLKALADWTHLKHLESQRRP